MVQMVPITPVTKELLADGETVRFLSLYTQINELAFPSDPEVYERQQKAGGHHDMLRTASIMRLLVTDDFKLNNYAIDGNNMLTIGKVEVGTIVGDEFIVDGNNKDVYPCIDDGLSYSVVKWFLQ